MAEVFRAKAIGVEGFEKLVAIKRILPNIAEDDEFITMFIDEAKISVQLSHPNVAQIYDLGKIDESYFIAMEFIAGKDLRTIFERARKRGEILPISMSCYVVARVLEGLDYAHRRKDSQGRDLHIVHRDVSPQNVLVSYEGEVKLIDFGIAKAANKASKTQAGILKGKFGYMSPEQVRGLPIDRRSDVFSAGIVLYELLTGERLFVGESDFSTLEKVRNVEIMPPTTYNRRIPHELEHIVLRALSREPEERYGSAAEMQEDLSRLLASAANIFSRRDLAQFMKQTFADDMGREEAALAQFREGPQPPGLQAALGQRETAVPLGGPPPLPPPSAPQPILPSVLKGDDPAVLLLPTDDDSATRVFDARETMAAQQGTFDPMGEPGRAAAGESRGNGAVAVPFGGGVPPPPPKTKPPMPPTPPPRPAERRDGEGFSFDSRSLERRAVENRVLSEPFGEHLPLREGPSEVGALDAAPSMSMGRVTLNTAVTAAPQRMPLQQGARRRRLLLAVTGVAIVSAAVVLFLYLRSIDAGRPARFVVRTTAGARAMLCEGQRCSELGVVGGDGQLSGEHRVGTFRLRVARAGCVPHEVAATLVVKQPNTFDLGALNCTAANAPGAGGPAALPGPANVGVGGAAAVPAPAEAARALDGGAIARVEREDDEDDEPAPRAKPTKRRPKPRVARAPKPEPDDEIPPPPPRPVAPEFGSLSVNLRGAWAYVHIDGRNTGKTTPLLGYRLKTGRYRVTLVRDELGFQSEFYVDIAPNRVTRALREYKRRD
jgi:serine/threonine protein kinase